MVHTGLWPAPISRPPLDLYQLRINDAALDPGDLHLYAEIHCLRGPAPAAIERRLDRAASRTRSSSLLVSASRGTHELVAVQLEGRPDLGCRLVGRALAPTAGFLAIRQVYFRPIAPARRGAFSAS